MKIYIVHKEKVDQKRKKKYKYLDFNKTEEYLLMGNVLLMQRSKNDDFCS